MCARPNAAVPIDGLLPVGHWWRVTAGSFMSVYSLDLSLDSEVSEEPSESGGWFGIRKMVPFLSTLSMESQTSAEYQHHLKSQPRVF